MRLALLILTGAFYGIGAVLLFRRLVSEDRIRLAMNRLLAGIMEFRLFIDEPAIIWKAQKTVLRANLALLRQIAIPCLALAIPSAFLYGTFNRYFGEIQLPVGESTVITAKKDRLPKIEGLIVETMGVRIPRTGEVSWRVRIASASPVTVPPGFRILYPTSPTWIWIFFAASSVSGLIALAGPLSGRVQNSSA